MEADVRLDVYVAVDNLERATEFYRMVFGDGPVGRTPNYVGFEFGGGRFGLLAKDGYSVPVQRGNSAIPTLMVPNVEAEHARLKAVASTVTELTTVGNIRMFMFMDPDGNVIEVAQES